MSNWSLTRDLPVEILVSFFDPGIPDPHPLPKEFKNVDARKTPNHLNFKKNIPLDYVALQLTQIDFDLFLTLKRSDLFRYIEEIDELPDAEEDILVDIKEEFNKVLYIFFKIYF